MSRHNAAKDGSESKTIYIIQPYTPSYRVAFFELLRTELATRGITLRIIAGIPAGTQRSRADANQLDWVRYESTTRISFRGRGLNWIRGGYAPRSASLVIVEQAISNLSLWRSLLRRSLRIGPPVATWGHGRIRTRKSHPAEDRLAWQLTRSCDWFFGYTAGSVADAVAAGCDERRVSVVQNAVDTRRMVDFRRAIATTNYRQASQNILYIGALDKAKGIERLLAAAEFVHHQDSAFRLILMGDGDLRGLIEMRAACQSWIDYRGQINDPAIKVNAASSAAALILPGRVGLAVVEAFALGLPVIATTYSENAPEYEYLIDKHNCLITQPTSLDLAAAMMTLLQDPKQQARLASAADRASEEYTLENMVRNFIDGVKGALRAES